jgi:hypothetical protein
VLTCVGRLSDVIKVNSSACLSKNFENFKRRRKLESVCSVKRSGVSLLECSIIDNSHSVNTVMIDEEIWFVPRLSHCSQVKTRIAEQGS